MINPILRDENIHFRVGRTRVVDASLYTSTTFSYVVRTNENTSFDDFDLIATSNMDFCAVIFMMVLCQVTSVGGM